MRERELEIAAAVWGLERMVGPGVPYVLEGSDAELVAGPRNVRRLLAELSELPTASRLTLLDEPVPNRGLAGLVDSSALAARGVAMRTVYRHDGQLSFEQRRYQRLLAAAGVRARQAPLVPVNMIIIDGETVMLPVDPDRPGAGAVVLRNTVWVYLARLVFDDCWHRATALSE
ncbi:hypothetical protein [Actinacidiphila acididurans]|uniref:Uncharacterized protein n=1 Tax=Actinacidiphila acididurans TaxID=2784346 RepID=A0ABS2TXG5_9ACTN|nr:hypothetical protein [Actinacidiphila acididurans]MBM9508038.1 hypothetical protein [Actinacidiphila acididurans]